VSPGRPEAWKSAADIPYALREPLGKLLLSLADNKRLLGMRYSEWILGAPTLEACIACSAMAQDEWGHGRILYAMLKELGYDPGALEHERESDEYLSSELLDTPPDDWPTMLALNALFDTALTIQCEALTESRFSPLHFRVRKLLAEERFHFEHARGWTARLAGADAGRQALADAFTAVLDGCLCWFGGVHGEIGADLAPEGLVDGDPDTLRIRWLARVGPLLEQVDVAAPDGAGALNWDGWNDGRRRSGAGGPDPDTLARVRGDKNRAMLMD
jgi:ring-1,2-phenylacetyl-CoA epoxidase subunit PaaC